MSVVISDEIPLTSRLSESELKVEIAVMLFSQEKLSPGLARRLAAMSFLQFQHRLPLSTDLSAHSANA